MLVLLFCLGENLHLTICHADPRQIFRSCRNIIANDRSSPSFPTSSKLWGKNIKIAIFHFYSSHWHSTADWKISILVGTLTEAVIPLHHVEELRFSNPTYYDFTVCFWRARIGILYQLSQWMSLIAILHYAERI